MKDFFKAIDRVINCFRAFYSRVDGAFLQILKIVISAIAAYTMAFYLNLPYKAFWGAIIFLFMIYIRYRKKNINATGEKRVCAFLAIFFSVFLILGHHIHMETHAALSDVNYIVGYTWIDIIAFFLLTYVFYLALSFLFGILPNLFHNAGMSFYLGKDKIKKRDVFICSIAFILMWMPYLITYYPAFIFGDSISSIDQAIAGTFNNHHPVLYTLLIQACLKIGGLFGGATQGCAVYSLIQMSYMVFGLSYMINWLYVRFSIHRAYRIALIIIYGFSPYIAQYTIAMWKDPIFSVTIVLLTLKLSDMIFLKEQRNKGISSIILFVLMLLMAFSRNNGIYIIYAIFAGCIVIMILRKHEEVYNRILIIAAFAIFCVRIVTGPIYSYCGVQEASKAEKYGVFLNQMARVVVYDGKLSNEDKEYLNQIMPLELYQSTYTPCCVDNFKWSGNFHADVLEKDFMSVYFSVLIKNPKICFEAWELQTYGFWSINCPEINQLDSNIAMGVPRNITQYTDATDMFGIQFATHEEGSLLPQLFPSNSRCIPVGMINWLLVIFFGVIILKKRYEILMAMLPSYGLMISLIVASPIYYWPRYGLAEQLLIPFYLVMLLEIFAKKK